MSDSRPHIRQLLDGWREQHADKLDPARFHLIDALEQRTADHAGAARRIMDERLARLVEAYANDVQRGHAGGTEKLDRPAGGPLGELVDGIAARTTARGAQASCDMAVQPSIPSTMEALDEFRGIWSRVRSQGQLRQSLKHLPTDAGPLNSGSLVHRSLTLMRELSPGYLQHFLAYLDALSGMEQLKEGGARENPRAATGRKRSRSSATRPG